MFIINLTYIQPLSEVERLLVEHIHFLKEHYADGTFICSGRKEPRTGGVILCKAASLEEVTAIYQQDPFFKGKIAEYQVIEFHPSMYSKEFEALL